MRDRYAVREAIGVLSDARGLYPRLTARENIRYYGTLHGLSGVELETRAASLSIHSDSMHWPTVARRGSRRERR